MSAAAKSRACRNDGINRTREALRAAGYTCLALHSLRDDDNRATGDLRIYGNGREVVMLKSIYVGKDVDGFDVYVPITPSNRVDDTIAAIADRTSESIHRSAEDTCNKSATREQLVAALAACMAAMEPGLPTATDLRFVDAYAGAKAALAKAEGGAA